VEAIFLVLIGALLFSQAWHMMGLYSDGRTVGVVIGSLGLLSLVALTLDAMLLTGSGSKTISAANNLSEITVFKGLIAVWAVYGVVVAAQSLWDLEERAVAFFSAAAAAMSIVSFFYFAGNMEARYGESVWLGLSAASLLLSVISAMVFFALGFNFRTLRPVAAWFMLLGGGVVAVIGMAIATRGIA
jgi:hypothetical protein